MKENKKLTVELEKIYKHCKDICEMCNYDCMKCPLCFLDNTSFRYYLCDIVSELLMLNECEKGNENYEK